MRCRRCANRPALCAFDAPGVGRYVWDLAAARALADGSGRPRLRVELWQLDAWVRSMPPGLLDEGHLAHVDEDFPGLAAQALHPSGSVRWVTIDGHHRQAKAWLAGKPFYLRYLTHAESASCLRATPPAHAAAHARLALLPALLEV
jgi:hypothetical protein